MVSGQNLNASKFFTHVFITCKNEDEGARVVTIYSLYKSIFSRRSKAAYSAALSLIWPNFELVRDFIAVLVTCENEGDPTRNETATGQKPI